jgi:type II secretory ATPase GspE/PulE/Tfp pilus assembly ATPase PilB-like protein
VSGVPLLLIANFFGKKNIELKTFSLSISAAECHAFAGRTVTDDRTISLLQPNDSEETAPQILERLVQHAEQAGASDIHLQMAPDCAAISFRLDGVMTPVVSMPRSIAERLFGRIKFLARLKTYQESMPQDGRIDKSELNAHIDIRVATYPTVTGEKVVLRLFVSSAVTPLSDLRLPSDARAELTWFLSQTSGMLLLTGPAGSGKTTTIYACLRELGQRGGRHVITIEDPAEQIIPGIMQTEVSEARGLDFAKAARHLLRQDPQVLVIGEVRDDETADIAIRAALTGHLVISTLHAGSCAGVVQRLLAMCKDHSAVAACLELIINQRLLRRLCPDCGGSRCSACLMTGYRGRLPVVEWLRISKPQRRDIAAQQLELLIARPSLAENAQHLVHDRLTNEAEVRRVLGVA